VLSDAGCLLRVAAIPLFFSKIKEEKLGAPQLFAAARGRKGAIESGGKREMESRAKALSVVEVVSYFGCFIPLLFLFPLSLIFPRLHFPSPYVDFVLLSPSIPRSSPLIK
jgi:hypothetical protein